MSEKYSYVDQTSHVEFPKVYKLENCRNLQRWKQSPRQKWLKSPQGDFGANIKYTQKIKCLD